MSGRYPVLVLGGTGVFGSRICRRLARDRGLRVFVGGRSLTKAARLAREIGEAAPGSDVRPCAVTLPDGLTCALEETGVRIVIHTCGPFQGQDTSVAETCIGKGVHYLDLADDRAFAAEFHRLDRAARENGVLAVSGV
ncbi:MAG: saccharopine dehydrogenase NADP-binding domain-containing protein, partial [Kiloniellales bacterium]|nr:saccharopine dehydrogenase NADP-binding domain-containing protein [Kiloniellales bacterium]